uniref:(California timema) hypothetical protein n=1 Tax=Timema californicum TaxID=61474 RepID=A0A7R9JKU0_TIMCA|nr:unnamed protein product [Timema californicum]
MDEALDLWMAGCMVFVFAALGEFVVVKVLDVRYQLDKDTRVATLPRILPMEKQPSAHSTRVKTQSLHHRQSSLFSALDYAATEAVLQAEMTQFIFSSLTEKRIHALDKPHCMTAWDVEGVRCRKPSLSFRNRGLVKLAWVDRATGQEKILWQEIDRQSRVLFPVLFLVFVIFYWPILLLKKS